MKKALVCLFVIILVITACTKTNEITQSKTIKTDTLASSGGCDTVNMRYSINIQPIISAHCYSCHGNGLSQNGVSLDSYDKLNRQVSNGNLIGVITHASGYNPMPEGGPKLSDCDINKIKDWIARGSLNN